MAFENLFKPKNLKRFLLALAAGAAALTVYFTAEHFQVVPATGALDVEIESPYALGPHSILVAMDVSAEGGEMTQPLALEMIRQLGQVEAVEVIAPGSAFALAAASGPSGIDPAWRLGIRNIGGASNTRLIAHLRSRRGDPQSTTVRQDPGSQDLARFVRNVVEEVVRTLGVAAEASPPAPRTISAAQYREFLLARFYALGGIKDMAMARQILDGILQQAPDWAPALAAQARILLVQASVGAEVAEGENRVERARALLERAAEADDQIAEVHLYRSLLAHRYDWDWQTALEAAEKAVALAPGDADVLSAASNAAFTLGHFEQGKAWLNRAITLDPLALGHRLKLGLMQEFGGEFDAAVETYRELMVKQPDFPGAHACLGRALLQLDRAQSALLHAEVEPSPFWQRYITALALYGLGRSEGADAALAELEALHGHEAAIQIAEVHAFAGHPDKAFEWLGTAVENRDPGVAELVGNSLLQNLADDPRWKQLLAELALPGND